MIQRLKTILLSTFAAAFMLVPAVPGVVSAASHAAAGEQDAISTSLCNGANLSADPTGECTNDGTTAQTAVDKIIKLVINVFSLIVGVTAVIMIIVGGLKYITSGGEGTNITGAKNTILYAIIGLVVVALAQIVVRFVLAKATGTAVE